MLDLAKYGWQQFAQLNAADVDNRYWRFDIIISVATPGHSRHHRQGLQVTMIIATSNNTSHINLEAARQREINVCNTPGLNSGNREHIQQICNQVINNINAWLKKQAINPVT